jgi:hypothetical protein
MTVGRFQVMSLLQAARAYILGLPLESAYSWGLNRAIFIAAAKRGFKGGSGLGEGSTGGKAGSKGKNTYFLGDDMAFKTEKGGVLLFTIGGKVQTKEEFDKRVKARFGESYQSAWKEALAYVKGFNKDTLQSTDDFFREVYKPVRDQLADKWTLASQANAN